MFFESILSATAIYLVCGLIFGIAFIILGVARLDPAAKGTASTFRLLILPGSVALWPYLAVRWLQRETKGENP